MTLPTEVTAYPLGGDYHQAIKRQQARWFVPDPGEYTTLRGRDNRDRPGRGEALTTAPPIRVPMVADLATASADLLFGEPAEIISEDDATTKRLATLMGTLESTLLEAAEYAAALSGVWLRVAWDEKVADHPLVQAISPAQVDATWRWGRVQSATIYHSVAGNGSGRWIHAEHHEPGHISHQLHSAPVGAQVLGPAFPLTHSPVTADLMPAFDLPGDTMALVYAKNMGPNINPKVLGEYGRADTAGLGHLLDSLDMTMTSWIRDVRLGKARIIMPNDMLRRTGRGKGATFDEDQEVYAGFDFDPKTVPKPEMIQPEIRTAAHAATVTTLMERIITSAGFSVESFGMHQDGNSPERASALRLRNHRTTRTVGRKHRYWRDALIPLAQAMLAIDSWKFGGKGNPAAPMRVQFGDTAAAGLLELAQTAQMLDAARSASTETRVRTVHPKWEDPEVRTEVERITVELAASAPKTNPTKDGSPPVATPTPNPGGPPPLMNEG